MLVLICNKKTAVVKRLLYLHLFEQYNFYMKRLKNFMCYALLVIICVLGILAMCYNAERIDNQNKIVERGN